MKNIIMTSAFFVLTLSAFSQTYTSKSEFSTDYEEYTYNHKLPYDYTVWGSHYRFIKDSATLYRDKYSLLIQPSDLAKSEFFGPIAFQIPSYCEGKEIELKVRMKLENWEDEPVAFVLKMNGRADLPLTFIKMEQNSTRGISDWAIYSAKTHFPKDEGRIYVGAMVYGRGKVWADNFVILIDGQEITQDKNLIKLSYAEKGN
jgi:hypothetical protein